MKIFKRMAELFWIFFKIGGFTFGGGLAMLPLIQKEVVDKRELVSEEEILDIFAVSQSVPGVIAINSAIFIGNRTLGLAGAIAAALGVILPAFISILLIVTILINLQNNVYVPKIFAGIRAASAALILLAALKLGKNAVKNKVGLIIAIASFMIIVIFNIHAAWAIVLSGLTGYIAYLYRRRRDNG